MPQGQLREVTSVFLLFAQFPEFFTMILFFSGPIQNDLTEYWMY